MSARRDIVVVGAGQAGFQIAATLRADGYDGRLTLIGDETHLPYHRPPLSKAYLKGVADRSSLDIRPETFFENHQIERILGDAVTAIDTRDRNMITRSGRRLAFDGLALATGTRARMLAIPGADLAGVHYLRSLSDADMFRSALDANGAGTVAIVGGGFIGLEVAATCRGLGAEVVVIEAAPRLMGRAVSPAISEFFLSTHRAMGTTVLLDAQVDHFEGDCRHVTHVVLADGQKIVAGLVLVGVGAIANTELAAAASVVCGNGIVVNEYAVTSNPDIVAAGDCTFHPNRFSVGPCRLESVQNASDQARAAAASLLGRADTYDAVPWFWSDQSDIKLQITGLGMALDETVLRGDVEGAKFSIFGFRGGQLVCCESINQPGDHVVARRLIQAGIAPSPAEIADPDFDLRGFVKARLPAR